MVVFYRGIAGRSARVRGQSLQFFMRCGEYVWGGNKKGQLHACTPAGAWAASATFRLKKVPTSHRHQGQCVVFVYAAGSVTGRHTTPHEEIAVLGGGDSVVVVQQCICCDISCATEINIMCCKYHILVHVVHIFPRLQP